MKLLSPGTSLVDAGEPSLSFMPIMHSRGSDAAGVLLV